jgi:hypothetical protein
MSTKLLFALSLFLPAHALASPLKISTERIEQDCSACVLEFEIRGVPESRGVALKRVPGGESVPCQVKERSSSGVRVVWIATGLKKGTQATWDVDLVPVASQGGKDRVALKPAGDNISVLVDGKELTRLIEDAGSAKPYLFPILGPNGKMITRQFPMKPGVTGEDQDHPHQRSLWFTHGSVGGIDFWSEGSKTGKVRKTRLISSEGGPVYGRIETSNEWVTAEGKKLLDDHRVLGFYPLERGETLIDVSVTLTAPGEDVVFGDTKEGTFGIRLAESMKEARGGLIVNSRGARGEKETWGKPAEWVDYSGKVEGDTVGVAILDHPKSFRHPTHWHVRGYGLFAANPFGYRDFYGDKSKDGSFKLEKGKSMEFRYRVYFHHGGADEANVKDVYAAFVSPPALHPQN